MIPEDSRKSGPQGWARHESPLAVPQAPSYRQMKDLRRADSVGMVTMGRWRASLLLSCKSTNANRGAKEASYIKLIDDASRDNCLPQ